MRRLSDAFACSLALVGAAVICAGAFNAELPLAPACTAQFRISKRLTPKTWVVGIPRTLGGEGTQCVLAHFTDLYTRDAFKLELLDTRRLRLVGLSRDVHVQATLFHPR